MSSSSKPPASITPAYNAAVQGQAAAKTPPAKTSAQTAPAHSYEMKGPIGQSVRREAFYAKQQQALAATKTEKPQTQSPALKDKFYAKAQAQQKEAAAGKTATTTQAFNKASDRGRSS